MQIHYLIRKILHKITRNIEIYYIGRETTENVNFIKNERIFLEQNNQQAKKKTGNETCLKMELT